MPAQLSTVLAGRADPALSMMALRIMSAPLLNAEAPLCWPVQQPAAFLDNGAKITSSLTAGFPASGSVLRVTQEIAPGLKN